MKKRFFVVLMILILSSGCTDKEECILSRDCEDKEHADCVSDWLCINGECVWGCMDCSLSLCDCKCYPKGETPEEETDKICGINCLTEFNVSGCEYKRGECVEVHEPRVDERIVNPTIVNPASAYCIDKGYDLEIRSDINGSQYGVCIFPGGFECEEWTFYRGECCTYSVSQPVDTQVNESDWMGVTFSGGADSVSIKHNLSYECCANISVSLNRTGNNIRVYEANTGEMCWSICRYSINVTVPGLDPGAYAVEVYGVGYMDTEADLLGNGTVTVL